MYTAEHARQYDQGQLDDRIRDAVQDYRPSDGRKGTYLRVYAEDPWCSTIKAELERRGFTNVDVPDIIIKGDVYFEWGD